MRNGKGPPFRLAGAVLAALLGVPAWGVAPLAHAEDPVDCEGPASDPPTFTAEWNRRDYENQWCATQRSHDLATNPLLPLKIAAGAPAAYQRSTESQLAEPHRIRLTNELVPGTTEPDPFRTRSAWTAAPARGRVSDVSFIASATGGKIVGEIWRPPASVPAPYPGVIVITGGTGQYRQLYYWAAQGLAEAGYMVLTYDSQGQGGSETFNHTDSGGSFCTPRGCPGTFPPNNDHVEFGVRDAIRFFTSTPSNPYSAAVPNTAGTNLYNPLHSEFDRRILDPSGRIPLGLAAHSVGAAFAMIHGQVDPRVSAIVSWDASIYLPTSNPDSLGKAHAHTLTIKADYGEFPTYNQAPPNPMMHQHGYRQLRDLCVSGKQCLDVMQISLRGSAHGEWTFLPGRPASRLGERVSFYYTRAWFDRFVKGPIDPATRSQALVRLRAAAFDASADTSSIGTGRAVLQGGTFVNQPHKIQGMSRRDRLSFYYRSSYYLTDGSAVYNCEDIRAGC